MAERAHPEDPAFQNKLFGLKKNKYRDYLFRRYGSCGDLIKDKVVLDVPCGVGWGTSLLKGARAVYGVDISEEAVSYASKHFQKKNFNYRVGNMAALEFDDDSFDVITCLEGFEHVDRATGLKFIEEVRRVLKAEALFVMTVPVLTNGKSTGNPYHLNEPAVDEIKKILDENFQTETFEIMPGPEGDILRFIGRNTKKSMTARARRKIRPEKMTLRSHVLVRLERAKGKHFVHFLHVGKAGGTAIKAALKPVRRTRKYIVKLHHHGTTLRDIPEGEKVFFFLRDPVSRFLSGYYSRLRMGQPRIHVPWTPEETVAFEAFPTPQQLVTALASENVEERTKAQNAMKAIKHVGNSFWEWFESEQYFKSRLADICFIGFQETLSQDFDRLKVKLGLSSDLILPTDDIAAHKNPAGIDLKLTLEQREMLKKWYAKDYAFYDLCRNLVEKNGLDDKLSGM